MSKKSSLNEVRDTKLNIPRIQRRQPRKRQNSPTESLNNRAKNMMKHREKGKVNDATKAPFVEAQKVTEKSLSNQLKKSTRSKVKNAMEVSHDELVETVEDPFEKVQESFERAKGQTEEIEEDPEETVEDPFEFAKISGERLKGSFDEPNEDQAETVEDPFEMAHETCERIIKPIKEIEEELADTVEDPFEIAGLPDGKVKDSFLDFKEDQAERVEDPFEMMQEPCNRIKYLTKGEPAEIIDDPFEICELYNGRLTDSYHKVKKNQRVHRPLEITKDLTDEIKYDQAIQKITTPPKVRVKNSYRHADENSEKTVKDLFEKAKRQNKRVTHQIENNNNTNNEKAKTAANLLAINQIQNDNTEEPINEDDATKEGMKNLLEKVTNKDRIVENNPFEKDKKQLTKSLVILLKNGTKQQFETTEDDLRRHKKVLHKKWQTLYGMVRENQAKKKEFEFRMQMEKVAPFKGMAMNPAMEEKFTVEPVMRDDYLLAKNGDTFVIRRNVSFHPTEAAEDRSTTNIKMLSSKTKKDIYWRTHTIESIKKSAENRNKSPSTKMKNSSEENKHVQAENEDIFEREEDFDEIVETQSKESEGDANEIEDELAEESDENVYQCLKNPSEESDEDFDKSCSTEESDGGSRESLDELTEESNNDIDESSRQPSEESEEDHNESLDELTEESDNDIEQYSKHSSEESERDPGESLDELTEESDGDMDENSKHSSQECEGDPGDSFFVLTASDKNSRHSSVEREEDSNMSIAGLSEDSGEDLIGSLEGPSEESEGDNGDTSSSEDQDGR